MKKWLIVCFVMAITAGPIFAQSGGTPSAVDTATSSAVLTEAAGVLRSLVVAGLDYNEGRTRDAAVGVVDAILGGIRTGNTFRSEQDAATMNQALRDLQIAVSEIPSLRGQVADIRVQLDKKADRKEVELLVKGLRADFEVEMKKLGLRVSRLETRVGNTERRLDAHDRHLDDLERRFSESITQRYLPRWSNLLLNTGGQVENVELVGRPSEKGVDIMLKTGEKRHYKAGEVTIVSVQEGYYKWAAGKYVFNSRDKGDKTNVENQETPKIMPKGFQRDSASDLEADLMAILQGLNKTQEAQLRTYAIDRGVKNWAKLETGKKLSFLVDKLTQDKHLEIRKFAADSNINETLALRLIIRQMAKRGTMTASK